MYRLLIIVGLALRCFTAFSQECNPENVTEIPGKWKTGMKGVSDHSVTDMVKEKALMDSIIQTVRTSFSWSPVGGDITYGNVYSIRGLDYRPKPVKKISNRYNAYIFFQHYYCASGKIGREDFVIQVTAAINEIPFEFPETFFESKKDKLGYDIETDPETDRYAFISRLPETRNDQIEFIKTQTGTLSGGDLVWKYRVLTRPGQLPYTVMNKKEYYEKWKVKLGK